MLVRGRTISRMNRVEWIGVFFALLMTCAWGAVKINERVKSGAGRTFIAYAATCVLFAAMLGLAYARA